MQRGCDSIAARDFSSPAFGVRYGCRRQCATVSDPHREPSTTCRPDRDRQIRDQDLPSSIRRLTDKGSSTVVRILEEAKNILVEDGFLGLSFRAIAKRTGTTVGNIGYYYGTKDDLMVDLAEYIFDNWELRVQRNMPPSLTDQRATFRYFIRSMIDQNKQRKTMFLLLEMWAMANRSDAVSKMMDTFYGRLRASIDGMIADLNPTMAAETRALRAALITTQIEGLMILVGPGKPRHRELPGIEEEAMAQIENMALRS